MSGRPKIPIYKYDENGKFLKKYESITEVRDEYFSEISGKYPVFRDNSEYTILPDETIIFKTRTYRDDVVHTIIKHNDKFRVKKLRPFVISNINGEEIARFSNITVASKLLNIPYNSILSFLRQSGGNIPSNKNRLSFKFLNNET